MCIGSTFFYTSSDRTTKHKTQIKDYIQNIKNTETKNTLKGSNGAIWDTNLYAW